MKFLIFLLLCTSRVFTQEISCSYEILGVLYPCNLSINNPNGFDGFTQISGEHLEGHSDVNVTSVYFLSTGITSNFPQIICQQFPSLRTIQMTNPNQQSIRTISENTFRNCSALQFVTLTSPINTINLNAFANNPILGRLTLVNAEVTTLPAELLSRNPILTQFDCLGCRRLTDLPSNFFQANFQLRQVSITNCDLQIFRPEWLQHLTSLTRINLWANPALADIPRNSFNSRVLQEINLSYASIRQIDFFSFNHLDSVVRLEPTQSPVEALDFNIFDRARNLVMFYGFGMECAWLSTNDFRVNRDQNLATLEPCFAAFDARILTFFTSGLAPTFNSIRRERILLGVQTSSNAIITFANNPDGSGSNFEVHLGADDNSQSRLFENGVLQNSRSTPGIVNLGRMENFEISWQNNMIIVAHSTPILVHIRNDLFPVRFIGVRQANGLHASWRIQQLA